MTTSFPPTVSTRSLGSLLKAPKGSAATTSSASPIRGGVAPNGKRIIPCPEIMLGVVTPYHSRSHSLVGQRECMGSMFSGSSVQTRRVLWVRTAKATDPKELLMVLAPSVGSSKGHYQRI